MTRSRHAVAWLAVAAIVSACGRGGSRVARTDSVPAATATPPAADSTQEDEWSRADRAIVRLPITVFPQLPAAFARELRGCSIPQSFANTRPHNVIQGSFAALGQRDWAVLCSRGDTAVILMWWGGPAQCSRELQPAKTRDYLQGIGDGRIGFSRAISTVDRYPDYGGEEAQYIKLEHDAIEDAFVEKASTIWICRNGKWVAIEGSD